MIAPDERANRVVIMAGGRGERFWPVSREKTPKQLIVAVVLVVSKPVMAVTVVTMRATVLSRPDGSTRTRSPGCGVQTLP